MLLLLTMRISMRKRKCRDDDIAAMDGILIPLPPPVLLSLGEKMWCFLPVLFLSMYIQKICIYVGMNE